MTRIDFYILPDVDIDAKFRFACRLAHRAIADGGQAHVRTASAEATAVLDALMWSYPEGRVLPHTTAPENEASSGEGHPRAALSGEGHPRAALSGEGHPRAALSGEGRPRAPGPKALVRIGQEEPPHGPDELLINLGDDIPAFFDRFQRVCEVVPAPEVNAGRARYSQYRRRGYPLHHHELDDWETAR